ncbi:Bbp19 family protein [Azospirillum doebereinerae]
MADPIGWEWLDGSVAAPAGGAEDPSPSFARCFAGTDGARVLATLKAMTLDRALGPDASDAALRHLEGQRQLVAVILALTARGQTR